MDAQSACSDKRKERCTLHINPVDAQRSGLVDGSIAQVVSRVGTVEIPVEVTELIMPGVVSIPHGWGHRQSGTQLHIASEHAGVNTNLLIDEEAIDTLSGNAALNGIVVTIEKM